MRTSVTGSNSNFGWGMEAARKMLQFPAAAVAGSAVL